MATRRHAVVLLVLCAVLWSTGGILIKWIAGPALAVAGLRSGIAAMVLLLALREWRGPGHGGSGVARWRAPPRCWALSLPPS